MTKIFPFLRKAVYLSTTKCSVVILLLLFFFSCCFLLLLMMMLHSAKVQTIFEFGRFSVKKKSLFTI